MNRNLKSLLAVAAFGALAFSANAERNPQAISNLLDRIGGQGASAMIETELDASIAANGKETFVITSASGKPFIKGSSLSALTTGINWYLNHTARENLTWNRLTTTFSNLPTPQGTETHTTAAEYRYYLNYCTFSYSMSTWTWERWEKEIDYMALHGINMPLQIIGLDVVWRNLLMKDYGYSADEANEFIAGPCFQAWWGMNNLEGWGGPNPDWWYERQEKLAGKILARMRELGIEPVLPGFAGMVPHNFTAKTGLSAITQGGWCGFTRPYILNPETEAFKQVAEKYYQRLAEVMGTSEYYSMDPFHEGANTSGIANIGNAYKAIYEAMDKAKPESKWVIQQWQWSNQQYSVLDNVPLGRLIVLDLFSDGNPKLNAYRGHDVIYCALPNFGGRTGFFGRLNGIINGYFNQKASVSAIKGVGATPEAIEQVPVLYDALFELPWHSTKPDPKAWTAEYAVSRYGKTNESAAAAWELLRNSALNCTSGLQGPQEAVMCARPSWSVSSVSTWGSAQIFYEPDDVANAAYALLDANLYGENYSYDLTDISRQALTDYSYYLLAAINEGRADKSVFAARKATFLNLMSDLDDLLGTNVNFMLGRWTNMARGIADEVSGTTDDDRNWLEYNNARTLITTWGDRQNSEGGGLRDYSYRQWNGMLKDYYRDRWEKFFDGKNVDWFSHDHAWAINKKYSYDNTPAGSSYDKAKELLERYLMLFDGKIVYRSMANDLSGEVTLVAYRGESFTLPLKGENADKFMVTAGSLSGIGTFTIPVNAEMGEFEADAVLDQTLVHFKLSVRDRVSAPRTVEVAVNNPAAGTASISGSTSSNVTTAEAGVTLTATAKPGYRFSHWSINGVKVSEENPYTYFGAADAVITANFVDASLLKAGDLNLTYETASNGAIVITGIDSGRGHADLAAASTAKAPIVALAPGAFAGSTDVKSVTLPASFVGLNGLSLSASLNGAGQENVIITPAEKIAKGSSWILSMNVSNTGATFNQWGSGLLSSGTNSLANAYNGGFQLYLNASGRIIVKTGSTENTGLNALAVGSEFTLTAAYDAAARTFSVGLTNASGSSKSIKIANIELDDIRQFASSIPAGVNINSLIVAPCSESDRPFAGCTALVDFNVESGNPAFSAENGRLLSADGKTLVAYPEGRLFVRSFRLLSNGKALYAAPAGDADGTMTETDRQVLASADAATSPASLLRLTDGDGAFEVMHLNSRRFFGGKAGSHDRVELPVSATRWHGEYSYSWVASGTDCLLSLNLQNPALGVASDGSNARLTSTPTKFTVDDECAVVLTGDVNVVALPISVLAPERAYAITGIDNDMLLTTHYTPGTEIAAGTGFIVVGKATLLPSNDMFVADEIASYLTGTMLSHSGMTPGSFFTFDPSNRTFVRSTTGNVGANSAFISASAFGNPIAAETLKVDIFDGAPLDEVSVSSDRNVTYFDIVGRPASRGFLIGSDGTKTINF